MNDFSENQTTDQADRADSRFPTLVYSLCGIIIVLLIGLWIMERGHRNRAEVRLGETITAVAGQRKKMQAFGQLVAAQATASKIMRSELPTKEIELDGKKQTALLLGASLGEKIGLQPGDIVLVTQPLD